MSEVLTLAQQLSGVSLATLLIIILFSSYRGWWVWGKQLTELKADYELRLTKYEASNAKWEQMAMRATGLAEDGVGIARKSNGV